MEHRLGDEGAGQRCTVLERAPAAAAGGRQELFHADEFEHRDEALVALADGTDVLLDEGEQLGLKGTPVRG